jgi:GTP-binding protein
LDAFTNARPKIAPYPFTTKIPNLGVLTLGSVQDSRDIIIADIPGLIEGASDGAGLGIRFLKHISRAAALVFLVDLSEPNYLEAFDILHGELESFSPDLTKKKRIICGSKLDLEGAPEALEKLREKYAGAAPPENPAHSENPAGVRPCEKVLGISVFSRAGLQELAGEIGILAGMDAAETPERTDAGEGSPEPPPSPRGEGSPPEGSGS